jgi:hypothetical protein
VVRESFRTRPDACSSWGGNVEGVNKGRKEPGGFFLWTEGLLAIDQITESISAVKNRLRFDPSLGASRFSASPAIIFLVLVLLSLPLAKATPPDWQESGAHQYAMVVYATVVDASGNAMTNPGSLLSVSEYGTLAGVTPVSKGPKGPVYQLKVGSDRWQSDLTYSFYDGGSDRVLQIGSGPGFESGSVVGSIVEPVVLTVLP